MGGVVLVVVVRGKEVRFACSRKAADAITIVGYIRREYLREAVDSSVAIAVSVGAKFLYPLDLVPGLYATNGGIYVGKNFFCSGFWFLHRLELPPVVFVVPPRSGGFFF